MAEYRFYPDWSGGARLRYWSGGTKKAQGVIRQIIPEMGVSPPPTTPTDIFVKAGAAFFPAQFTPIPQTVEQP